MVPDKWSDVCEALRGSCMSLHTAVVQCDVPELEDHLEFLEWLDQEIFLCEDCGWWCEISEESSEEFDRVGDLVCRSCAEGEEG